jgi:hypothetical protein
MSKGERVPFTMRSASISESKRRVENVKTSVILLDTEFSLIHKFDLRTVNLPRGLYSYGKFILILSR